MPRKSGFGVVAGVPLLQLLVTVAAVSVAVVVVARIFSKTPVSSSTGPPPGSSYSSSTRGSPPGSSYSSSTPGSSVLGLYQQGSSVPGPYQQGSSVPGPYKQGSSVLGPYQQGSSVPGPYQQGSSVPGPYKQGSSVPSSVQGSSVPSPPEMVTLTLDYDVNAASSFVTVQDNYGNTFTVQDRSKSYVKGTSVTITSIKSGMGTPSIKDSFGKDILNKPNTLTTNTTYFVSL